MSKNTINANDLAKMFLAGAKNLEAKKEWINELNVFPVPDGDTGTNMTMTIMSAAKDVNALMATNDITMETLCKAISSGSLKGARGNSGVILSQLLRGFTKVAKVKTEITIPDLADAFEKGVETAYKAVMKPKEGTILTVAKSVSLKGRELADAGANDLEDFIRTCIEESEVSLAHTPELLPVLKQAGVVDSGGQGLVEVFHGAFDAFMGKEIDLTIVESKPENIEETKEREKENLRFDYATEYEIYLDKTFNIKHELDFKTYLESIGDSITLVVDEAIVKVNLYTNDPGLALQKALKYGALTNIKIENVKITESPKACKDKEPAKDYGFVSVAAGDGLSDIFKVSESMW